MINSIHVQTATLPNGYAYYVAGRSEGRDIFLKSSTIELIVWTLRKNAAMSFEDGSNAAEIAGAYKNGTGWTHQIED